MTESCLRQLRTEFRLKQFGFRGIVNDRIFFSQWRIPPLAFITIKLVLTVYVDFWLMYTADQYVDIDIGGKGTYLPWTVFLTNWTYTLLALYLTLSTVAMIIYHVVRSRYRRERGRNWFCSTFGEDHGAVMQEDRRMRPTEEETSGEDDYTSDQVAIIGRETAWYVVLIWILFSMAVVATPLVTLIFFAFLYSSLFESGGIDNGNLQLHGLNTVCMLIDFLFFAFPVRLLHVIYPFIYCLIYLLFSVIYWAGNHDRVMYPGVLDWNEPGKTVLVMLLVIVVIVVFQFLLYGLHRLKLMTYARMYHYQQYEPIE